MQARRWIGRCPWLFWLACACSIAFHLGVVFFLLNYHAPGVAAPPTTAISINLEASEILDASDEDQQAPTSSAARYIPLQEEVKEDKPEDVAPPPEVAAKPELPQEDQDSRPPVEQEKANPGDKTEASAESAEAEKPAEEALRPAEQALPPPTAPDVPLQEQAQSDKPGAIAPPSEVTATEPELSQEENSLPPPAQENAAENTPPPAEKTESEKPVDETPPPPKEAEKREPEQAAPAGSKDAERKRTEDTERERKAEIRKLNKRRQRDQAEKQAEEEARRRRQKQQQQNAAQGSQAAQPSTGRVSASRGSAMNYRAIVNAHMARRRPAAVGAGGQVYIQFRVSPSGELSFVRILRLSGDPARDRAALATVQQAAPFPRPPEGTTDAERTFNIRFQ